MSDKVQKFRVALYGVLIENNRVLVTHTRVPSGIITNFPGGGLELGEAPVEAVSREFQEETGITVAIQELLFCSQQFQQNPEYPTEQLIHIFYLVERMGGELITHGNNDDVASVEWVSLNDLEHKRVLAVDREFTNHAAFRLLFE